MFIRIFLRNLGAYQGFETTTQAYKSLNELLATSFTNLSTPNGFKFAIDFLNNSVDQKIKVETVAGSSMSVVNGATGKQFTSMELLTHLMANREAIIELQKAKS